MTVVAALLTEPQLRCIVLAMALDNTLMTESDNQQREEARCQEQS
jgi:hypothetical protein